MLCINTDRERVQIGEALEQLRQKLRVREEASGRLDLQCERRARLGRALGGLEVEAERALLDELLQRAEAELEPEIRVVGVLLHAVVTQKVAVLHVHRAQQLQLAHRGAPDAAALAVDASAHVRDAFDGGLAAVEHAAVNDGAIAAAAQHSSLARVVLQLADEYRLAAAAQRLSSALPLCTSTQQSTDMIPVSSSSRVCGMQNALSSAR